MIPDFLENGYLPPGIHAASLDEVKLRFGQSSEIRRAQFQSIEWLIPICRDAGISRLVLNGSYVTDISEPNDVDCILLQGPAYNEYTTTAARLEEGLPFLSVQIVRLCIFDSDIFQNGSQRCAQGACRGAAMML